MIRFALADLARKWVVKVTKNGQLLTAPYAYDETKFVELAADNTAYNFYEPKVKHNFVITAILAKADQQVSNTADADVVIYEASSQTETTVDKTLLQWAMLRNDILSLSGLNILVSEGKFINAKTTDDDIHLNIMGYYIPVTT